MKRLLLLIAIFMATVAGGSVQAANLSLASTLGNQDTIVIKLPNGANMTLYVKDTKQLKSFQEYKLDSLMRLLSIYVEKVEEMEKGDKQVSKEVTMTFYPSKDLKDPAIPEQITITLSTSSVEQLRKEGKSKSFGEVVKVFVDYKDNKENTTDSIEIKRKQEKKEKRNRKESYLDLGVNTFVNLPDNTTSVYDLKPLGSRYVSIGSLREGRIGSKNSPLYIRGGLELAFNNFMFDNNRYLTLENGQAVLLTEPETGRSLEKSKLTYSTLSIPLDFSLQFKDRNGKESLIISAGGFAGYRLGAHTKLKYQEGGKTRKDKEHDNFNLEDFQYGATFAVGYRDLQLFGKYNLNSLFKDNRGPDMQVVSFGFRVF